MVAILKPHQLIECVKPYMPANPIIVEAGAFDGKDTLRLAAAWPTSTIHAFEPVPEIFTRLESNTVTNPIIKRYPLALSDHNGTAEFYVAEKPGKPGVATQAGSLHKPKKRIELSPLQFPRTITVPTITLPTWAAQHNISHIDFLWLDLQGHELPVLQAAGDFINKIRVIQTEVGFVEAYEGQQPYEQVKAWLAQYNFEEIARDFADQSSWFFGNALFVRKM
jgi:FkbM family methyltransferase